MLPSSSKKSTMRQARNVVPSRADPTAEGHRLFSTDARCALVCRPDALRTSNMDFLARLVEILTERPRAGARSSTYVRRVLIEALGNRFLRAVPAPRFFGESHALPGIMEVIGRLAASVARENLAGTLPFDDVELRDTLVHLPFHSEELVRSMTDPEAPGRLLRQVLWDYWIDARHLPVMDLQDMLILRNAQLRAYRRHLARNLPVKDPDHARFTFVRPGRLATCPRSQKEFWADLTAWDILVFDAYQATGDGRRWGWLLGGTVNPFNILRSIEASHVGGRKLHGVYLWEYMK